MGFWNDNVFIKFGTGDVNILYIHGLDDNLKIAAMFVIVSLACDLRIKRNRGKQLHAPWYRVLFPGQI